MLNGGDVVQMLVQRCRELGIAPFVSFRINDTHLQEFVGKPHPRSSYVCRFYEEHLEYLLYPDHLKTTNYSHRRGQDWTIPEVREYKFQLMKELIENYDLDGFEIDFLRDHVIFDPEKTTSKQRIEIITNFIKRIRGVMDQAKPDKYMFFSIRIPCELAAQDEIGLDVEKLYDAGVDIFNLSGWYHTTQQNDVARIRKLLPHAAIILEMTHSAGAMYFAGNNRPYGTASFPRTCDQQFYTTANLAYNNGADGLSFFNFVYYRDHGTAGVAPIHEPPFHVLGQMRDPEWLAQQPQYCWLAKWTYLRQVPKTLAVNKTETFHADMAPPTSPKNPMGRFRIHTKDPIPENGEITVTFNGHPLTPTEDVSAFYDNPYDGMLSDAPRRRAWKLPVDITNNGQNTFSLTWHGPENITVEWIDWMME